MIKSPYSKNSTNLQSKYSKFLYLFSPAILILIVISIFVFHSFTFLLGILAGIIMGVFTFTQLKYGKKAKLMAGCMAFVIGITGSFMVGALSSTLKLNQTANSQGIQSSSIVSKSAASFGKSASSPISQFEWSSKIELVDLNYNISPLDKKINLNLIKQQNKEIWLKMNESTKGKKSFLISKVLSSSSILIDEIGIIQLIGLQNPSSGLSCFESLGISRLNEILLDKSIYLEFDQFARYDSSNRTLAYVYLESGFFVNQEMILDGYSVKFESGNNYKAEKEFDNAQTKAKQASSGIWSNESCSDKKADISSNNSNISINSNQNVSPSTDKTPIPIRNTPQQTSSRQSSLQSSQSVSNSIPVKSQESQSSVQSVPTSSPNVSSAISKSASVSIQNSVPIDPVNYNGGLIKLIHGYTARKKCVYPANTNEYMNNRDYEGFSTMAACLERLNQMNQV